MNRKDVYYREGMQIDSNGNILNEGHSEPFNKHFYDDDYSDFDNNCIIVLGDTYLTSKYAENDPNHYCFIVYSDGTLLDARNYDTNKIDEYMKLKTSPIPYKTNIKMYKPDTQC